MSPLAEAIYEILRQRLSETDPRVSYAELAEVLRDLSTDFEAIYHRSQQLYAALGEIGQECRRLRLPPLPALVVRADTRRPGAAYYEGRCSGLMYHGERVAAWRRDLEAVRQATYPERRKDVRGEGTGVSQSGKKGGPRTRISQERTSEARRTRSNRKKEPGHQSESRGVV
jgi:hypothetical protein